MNYYEELGLTQQASAEEIRRGYRNLSRILHPDQQKDEDLRRLAENQMKRLNMIHDVLTDPGKRRVYDSTLGLGATEERSLARATPQRPAWPNSNLLFWLLIAALSAGSAIWSWRTPIASTRRLAVKLPAQPKAAQPKPAPAARKTSAGPNVVPELANHGKQDADPPGQPPNITAEKEIEFLEPVEPPPIPVPTVGFPITEIPAPAVIQAPTRVEIAPAPGTDPFAGIWIWVRPRNFPASGSLYPPDYIELTIAQKGRFLEGRYRARYRIHNRAISPQVQFRFGGSADAGTARLPWAGAGGAKGEVFLRLLSLDSMEVKWGAVELGSQLDLASGDAVLIRRRDP